MANETGGSAMRPAADVLAAVTTDREAFGGSVPIVFAKDDAEKENLAFDLGRVLRADVYQLPNGQYLLLAIRP